MPLAPKERALHIPSEPPVRLSFLSLHASLFFFPRPVYTTSLHPFGTQACLAIDGRNPRDVDDRTQSRVCEPCPTWLKFVLSVCKRSCPNSGSLGELPAATAGPCVNVAQSPWGSSSPPPVVISLRLSPRRLPTSSFLPQHSSSPSRRLSSRLSLPRPHIRLVLGPVYSPSSQQPASHRPTPDPSLTCLLPSTPPTPGSISLLFPSRSSFSPPSSWPRNSPARSSFSGSSSSPSPTGSCFPRPPLHFPPRAGVSRLNTDPSPHLRTGMLLELVNYNVEGTVRRSLPMGVYWSCR